MTLKTVIKIIFLLIAAFMIYQYTVVSQMPINPVENTPSKSIRDEDGMALLKKVESADFDELLTLYRPDLDGAYAEGFGAALYREFKEIGAESIVSKLSACPKTTKDGVLKLLISEMKISEDLNAVEALQKALQN